MGLEHTPEEPTVETLSIKETLDLKLHMQIALAALAYHLEVENFPSALMGEWVGRHASHFGILTARTKGTKNDILIKFRDHDAGVLADVVVCISRC